MQLSRFTDLGLRAMMRLAVSAAAEERVTAKLIARQVNASEHYVAKAVTKLSDLGLVDSQRGRTGGIFLTDKGRSATVGAIVRGLEGAGEVVDCAGEHPCPLASACRLRRMLAQAQERFYRVLDGYTLGDLVDHRTVALLHLEIPHSGA
ncbi:RrF2 family transcriptional regulator [Nocardia sp. alder85J]|uniref:RrF2 family transcriptional regulator n=1 Tax=Nocardia sp. alder85J TaxID=2862949 RepID=UPI001CD55557|nr:Rrf2 family transcriptional regulator [Nocardia sp. alder85J]MCX4093001.1 Rrf2 family transcriptional regulator [Nocardia sp. alder85J]